MIIALPVVQPKIEFVVINTERVDYLQSEFSQLSGGGGVVLDSISIRRQERGLYEKGVTLEVHWRWAQVGRDSVFPAVRRVQFLDTLPLTLEYAPVGAIVRMVAKVDTVWTCNDGRCQIAQTPKVVQNYEPHPVMCAIACVQEDSATVATRVRDRLRTTGLAVGLKPVMTERPTLLVGWRQTTGEELLTGICEKLPGNRGNLVAPDLARFDVSSIYDPARKLGLPWSIDYLTGPVKYVYNRRNDPADMIFEAGPWLVNDTLVKFGRSLRLSGNTRRVCGRVINDSAVTLDSWLVVPDSGRVEAVDRALSPGFCGQRNSAWRMTGDTVWLGKVRWPILLEDLLGTASLRDPDQESAGFKSPRVVGTRLELPFDALVTARSPSGRILAGRALLAAGSHELDLAWLRGAFVVEIRTPDGQPLLLMGNALGR
ncbi:MAG: hypothetical protein IPK50_10790 [Fibrobacterota bacterium]|nr:hypothetical protein [Fibrobacterota bacterium]QQS07363.1 MAG: hypothetical protein IPK50_10790 [Fibrobacterota bacterium]